MKVYLVQVGYKSTSGKLRILGEKFEGETPDQALEMAKTFYSDLIKYRSLPEMIFSTPIEISSTCSEVVGSNTKIVTGNNNVVVQSSKHNINISSVNGAHFGDTYY